MPRCASGRRGRSGGNRVQEAAAALRTALGDEEGDVRERAAWALGRIRDDAALDGLLELLRDPVREVRERAAWALGTLRNPVAVDGLVAALDDADALHEVIEALARIGGERAMEALVQLIIRATRRSVVRPLTR